MDVLKYLLILNWQAIQFGRCLEQLLSKFFSNLFSSVNSGNDFKIK